MENTARFRFPVHPMLITIPLGFFVAAIIFDTFSLFTKSSMLPVAAFLTISAGIVSGFLAAIFGFKHWLSIPDDTLEQRTSLMRGLNILIVVLLFVFSWWLRSRNLAFAASPLALGFSYFGILVTLLSAWMNSVPRIKPDIDDEIRLGFPTSIFDDQTEGSAP
jgi:uncharacterized membrane protein